MDIAEYVTDFCVDTDFVKICCYIAIIVVVIISLLEFFNHGYENYCNLYVDLDYQLNRFWNLKWLFCRRQEYYIAQNEKRYRNDDGTYLAEAKFEGKSSILFLITAITFMKQISDIGIILNFKGTNETVTVSSRGVAVFEIHGVPGYFMAFEPYFLS